MSRQRKQKKLLDARKPSQITAERVARLEKIGFEWRPGKHDDRKWELRFEELEDFKDTHGHCRVPQDWKVTALSLLSVLLHFSQPPGACYTGEPAAGRLGVEAAQAQEAARRPEARQNHAGARREAGQDRLRVGATVARPGYAWHGSTRAAATPGFLTSCCAVSDSWPLLVDAQCWRWGTE